MFSNIGKNIWRLPFCSVPMSLLCILGALPFSFDGSVNWRRTVDLELWLCWCFSNDQVYLFHYIMLFSKLESFCKKGIALARWYWYFALMHQDACVIKISVQFLIIKYPGVQTVPIGLGNQFPWVDVALLLKHSQLT